MVSEMCKCTACGRWWSTNTGSQEVRTHCPCGGTLQIVNMTEHAKTLPYSPYDPSKDPKAKPK
jgi:predicted  nucleic acid-binding Zn-ribbon protein